MDNEGITTRPLVLSYDELCIVTGRRRHSAQARALADMHISFRLRPDGLPLVSRAHFEQAMGEAGADTQSKTLRKAQPNWGALDAA